MRRTLVRLIVLLACPAGASPVLARTALPAPHCPWPEIGAQVPEPAEVRSRGGELRVDIEIDDDRFGSAGERYCYRTADGLLAPTLRVSPGDLVILRLRNRLTRPEAATAGAMPAAHAHEQPAGAGGSSRGDPCTSGAMAPTSTNLHFHGMTIPALCHQDEVLKTSVQPDDPPFEYRFRVPLDAPPGLYWYHPHIHGFSSQQVSGGASGAMIVAGLERAIPEVAGLPERVLVIRDLKLINPDAPPSVSDILAPKPVLDADGDAGNNNTGSGKPARDLSVNFVPVPYPNYTPARILTRPSERQLWRVLNASAITYVHLALLYDQVAQGFGVVAIDGVPVNYGDPAAPHVKTVDHLVVPPGSRAEFIVQAPPVGTRGMLISRTVNTGQDGENVPNRTLASIEVSANAREPASRMPPAGRPLPPPRRPWVGSVTPVRTRKLYFSERRADPSNPNSPTLFFLTVDGQQPRVFDPQSSVADIVVHLGDVEDWIIENRSLELHAFHIHQLHFQVREWYGIRVDEPFLRDTVSVPFFDNHMKAYPSVKVRLDFRDPNTVGTLVYHCHLLEHEDAGMMGTIRVEP